MIQFSSFFVPFLETLRFFITINEKIIIKTKILNGCIKYIKIKLQIENLLFTLDISDNFTLLS